MIRMPEPGNNPQNSRGRHSLLLRYGRHSRPPRVSFDGCEAPLIHPRNIFFALTPLSVRFHPFLLIDEGKSVLPEKTKLP